MPQRYQIGKDKYEIPDDKVNSFLAKYPNAVEIGAPKSFFDNLGDQATKLMTETMTKGPFIGPGGIAEQLGAPIGKAVKKGLFEIMPESKDARGEASRQMLGFVGELLGNPVNFVGLGGVGKQVVKRGAGVFKDITKSGVKIPIFGTTHKTEDALKLGAELKGNKEGIAKLKFLEKKFGDEFNVVKETGNLDEAMIVSYKKQLYREAREVAEGTGGAAEYVAKQAKPLEKIAIGKPIKYPKAGEYLRKEIGREKFLDEAIKNNAEVRFVNEKGVIDDAKILEQGVKPELYDNGLRLKDSKGNIFVGEADDFGKSLDQQFSNLTDDLKVAISTAKKYGDPKDVLKLENELKAVTQNYKGAKPLEKIPFVKPKRPLDDIKRLGQSKMRQHPVIEGLIKTDADEIARFRGKPIPEESVERMAKKLSPERANEVDVKFNTGGRVRGRQVLNEFGNEFESTLEAFHRGEVSTPLGKVMEQATMRGRALQAAKADKDKAYEIADEYLKSKEKTYSPEDFKKFKKYVEDMYVESGLGKPNKKPTFTQMFVEYATMAKLTGLSTQLKSVTGNVFMMALRTPEKFFAGAADAILYPITRKRNVYTREAFSEIYGFYSSFKESARKAVAVLGDETKAFGEATKSGEALLKGGRGAIPGKLGKVVRTPVRLLGAGDQFFRNLNVGMEMSAQTFRRAKLEGLSGAKLAKRIEELRNAPPADLAKIAKDKGAENVFQEALPKMLKDVNKLRLKYPLTRLIVPFFNTMVNLFKQGMRRVPVANLTLPSEWKTIFKGTAEARRNLIGRQAMGVSMFAGTTFAAMEGHISSGGPRSTAKRNVLRLTGWQPYSVKIGDTWVSYRGFEPISTWLRFSADIAEGRADGDTVAQYINRFAESYGRQFVENPFLMGVKNVIDAVGNEARFDQFVAGMVTGSTIPVILQQWGTRVFDPIIREPKGIKQRIMKNIPFGGSKTVPAMRDIFGEPITRQHPVSQAFGFTISVDRKSKLNNELARLKMGIGKPSRTVDGYTMSDEEYDRFYILKGAMLKESMKKYVASPAYAQTPDVIRIKTFRSIIRNVNKMAKAREMSKYYRSK